MNRVRIAQRGLGQALGRLAGRREQQVRHAALFQKRHQDPHAGGLAHARTAADDRHLRGERGGNRPPLIGFENDLVLRFRLGHGGLQFVWLEQRRSLAEQLRQAGGGLAFRVVQTARVNMDVVVWARSISRQEDSLCIPVVAAGELRDIGAKRGHQRGVGRPAPG